MPKQTKQPKSEQPKKKAPTKPHKPDEEADAKMIERGRYPVHVWFALFMIQSIY